MDKGEQGDKKRVKRRANLVTEGCHTASEVYVRSTSDHINGLLNLKYVISASGSVSYLIPKIKVEILNIEHSIEVVDVEEIVRGSFDHGSATDQKVSLTKRPFRVTRKACPAKGSGGPEAD